MRICAIFNNEPNRSYHRSNFSLHIPCSGCDDSYGPACKEGREILMKVYGSLSLVLSVMFDSAMRNNEERSYVSFKQLNCAKMVIFCPEGIALNIEFTGAYVS
jgi:hypothetical protein